MSFTAPNILPSGMTFAQFQQGGYSAALEASIAANKAGTHAPTAAPTLTASGSGGTLPANQYFVVFTETNGVGETTASTASAGQVITLGQDLVITYPALQTGNTARNAYVGFSNVGPFVLAAIGVTASTTTISAPLPTNSLANQSPPTVNTTAYSYSDANGNIHNTLYNYIRSAKDNNVNLILQNLAQVVRDFNRGNPMPIRSVIEKITQCGAALQTLATEVNEVGALIAANPGTIQQIQTASVASPTLRRTWP